jgi:hypothetical protein
VATAIISSRLSENRHVSLHDFDPRDGALVAIMAVFIGVLGAFLGFLWRKGYRILLVPIGVFPATVVPLILTRMVYPFDLKTQVMIEYFLLVNGLAVLAAVFRFAIPKSPGPSGS